MVDETSSRKTTHTGKVWNVIGCRFESLVDVLNFNIVGDPGRRFRIVVARWLFRRSLKFWAHG